MKLQFSTIAAAAVLSLSSAVAWGHFGIVIPEHSAVLEQKDANVHFTIAFAHPMERNGMTMAKPDAFYVVQDGRKTDLSGSHNSCAPPISALRSPGVPVRCC